MTKDITENTTVLNGTEITPGMIVDAVAQLSKTERAIILAYAQGMAQAKEIAKSEPKEEVKEKE